MKRKTVHWLVISFCLFACTREEVTVQIVRRPLVSCTIDSVLWKPADYFFTIPYQVVAYPSNPALPGRWYHRFTFQASGQDNQGNNRQLTIEFDAADSSRLAGVYRPAYTNERGLALVRLYNLDNNNLSVYALCAGDSTAFLQIQKQSQKEQLITGVFQMVLCNTRDTARKIVIRDGVLTDIHY